MDFDASQNILPLENLQEGGPANSGRLTSFYLTGQDMTGSLKWKYVADLDMLRSHSQLFATKLVNGQEYCALDITYYNRSDEFTTVLKIMRYIDVVQLLRPHSYIYEVPAGAIQPEELARFNFPATEATPPFDNTESYPHLFNLWLCGNQIRSSSITRYLVLAIFLKVRATRHSLSSEDFIEYWVNTNDNEHEVLRRLMVTVVLMSPDFEENREWRSQMLSALPDEVKEAMIHQTTEHRSRPVNAYSDFVSNWDILESIEE
ncbi:hypothetical protein N0V93_009251 [Gnomoniopsis smithogilvyi]|uniref:Uncharacterized protein n=1 Tax=Gnomoniopsis smithogilvyi TaxID=1191159 RepID=A0A9W8YKR4_9PEZI|nr:hypothetical protein N0V93_009251 [Gnomoniopsis smithogilvyi]